jgi:hypothetical protein
VRLWQFKPAAKRKNFPGHIGAGSVGGNPDDFDLLDGIIPVGVQGELERLQGIKPLDLASVLKKRIQPAFRRIGITGVGWHAFRHSVGTMLAEIGRTSTHNPRLLAAQQPSCHEQVPAGDLLDVRVASA